MLEDFIIYKKSLMLTKDKWHMNYKVYKKTEEVYQNT